VKGLRNTVGEKVTHVEERRRGRGEGSSYLSRGSRKKKKSLSFLRRKGGKGEEMKKSLSAHPVVEKKLGTCPFNVRGIKGRS